MPDIYHQLTINAPGRDVFEGIAFPKGLDAWWTKTSNGKPEMGNEYRLDFGPEYKWKAIVTKCRMYNEFEWNLTQADADWIDTKVGFLLQGENNFTRVLFYHLGWPQENDHYKRSNYCWAMYLRILKRYLEFGEFVSYEIRLKV